MKATVYTQEGKKKGDITLPEAVYGAPFKRDLVHSVVVAMQANARAGTAHTKDRSEVRGGGKKPWRQKGTGRARHGSRRSPIWTGGGVTFGPRNERDFSKKVNRKMRAKALASVLSKKNADAEMVFLDTLSFDAPKTSVAKGVFESLANATKTPRLTQKRTNATLVVLPKRDEVVEKSLRNFGNIAVTHAKDLNTVDVLTYTYLVVVSPDEVHETLNARIAGVKAKDTAKDTE